MCYRFLHETCLQFSKKLTYILLKLHMYIPVSHLDKYLEIAKWHLKGIYKFSLFVAHIYSNTLIHLLMIGGNAAAIVMDLDIP